MDVPNSASEQLRSFWQRKEGNVGLVVVVALCAAGLYGFSLILPWLLELAANTITLVAELAVLGVVFAIVSQKRFWTLCSYFFKSIIARLTNLFIPVFGIDIMKDYVKKLRKKAVVMREQIAALFGQMRTLKEKMFQNEAAISKNLGILKQAQKQNPEQLKMVMVKNARSAGRLKESNMTYADLYRKMETLYNVMKKYSDAIDFYIDDIQGQVEQAEEKKNMIDKAKKTMSTAKSILTGTSDEALLYNETQEKLAQEYGNELGKIEDFMDSSKPFLQTIDLENMSYEESALQLLDSWENSADSLVSTGEIKKQLTQGVEDVDTSALNTKVRKYVR